MTDCPLRISKVRSAAGLRAEKVRGTTAVDMGTSRDVDVESLMTADVETEVATDSDLEDGVADPLHPISPRIVRVPSESETKRRKIFSPQMAVALLNKLPYAPVLKRKPLLRTLVMYEIIS